MCGLIPSRQETSFTKSAEYNAHKPASTPPNQPQIISIPPNAPHGRKTDPILPIPRPQESKNLTPEQIRRWSRVNKSPHTADQASAIAATFGDAAKPDQPRAGQGSEPHLARPRSTHRSSPATTEQGRAGQGKCTARPGRSRRSPRRRGKCPAIRLPSPRDIRALGTTESSDTAQSPGMRPAYRARREST